MLVNDFLQLADSLPEALILLNGEGAILAASHKAMDFLTELEPEPVGSNLSQFLDNNTAALADTLRLMRRSRMPIPARLKWHRVIHEFTHGIQCQGFLLDPAQDSASAQLVLRCLPGRSMARDFVSLNEELMRQKSLLVKLQASREALEEEHEKALVTLHSIGDAVITTDAQGRVEFLNPIAEILTGWSNSEAKGCAINQVFNIINEVSRRAAPDPIRRCLQEGQIVGLANHTALLSRDGTEYVIEDSAAPIRNPHGKVFGAVLVFRDVTGDRLARRQLEYLAQHDTLTGLKNRYYFEQQLGHLVEVTSRGKHIGALLYIDLDQFKIVNDTAGHAAGDKLLTEVARNLAQRVRQGDILARLGGDEFGVLLESIEQTQLMSIAEAYAAALESFHFHWNGSNYDVTCSIGITVIDQQTRIPAEAMRQADIACYMAKHHGRNRCHLYQPEDEQHIPSLGEIGVVNDLKDALQSDRLVLHFQPITDIRSNEVILHEALLRLRDRNGELLTPAHFIPIAERYGLMNRLDEWVVIRAVQFIKEQRAHGKVCRLSVNLSGMSLGDGKLLEIIKRYVSEDPRVAHSLVLEVTETAAVTHIDKASRFISELRDTGVQFALDDFGTGFSSFAYLKHLPVDFIKIDGTFVRDIVDDPVDQAMVRSINHIAHSLGKKTVAEFVENAGILALLQEIGVDFVQGYHIGRPAAPDTLHPHT